MWNLKEMIVELDADGGTVIGDITLIAVLYRVISWRMSSSDVRYATHALCKYLCLVCVCPEEASIGTGMNAMMMWRRGLRSKTGGRTASL